MAQKLDAPMPDGLDIDQDYMVLFTAVDDATGDPVPAVNVSQASLIVAQLSGGDPGDLVSGPFQLIPLDVQP